MDDEALKDTQLVALGNELSEDAEPLIGRTIAGKYRVTRRLARGGMGIVYIAEHTMLGREVVFKVLSYHLSEDERAKSRFEREARGLSVLDHPNIVTVHDFGHEGELTYLVMEYVPGENLSQRLRRKGRIAYDELLPIAVQCIDALAAAHDKAIVHRDIKPSNVMITSRGGREDFVKVLDFGLAKLASSSVDITKGNLVGTVSYLAPEVIRGGEATPASDVYALGVMVYYLLTGSKPFAADDEMSVLYQHVNVIADSLHEIVTPGEAPPEFLDFIHTCIEKEPGKRPQNAGEMNAMLAELVSVPSISAFSLDSSLALPRYRAGESTAAPAPRLRSPSSLAHHTPVQPSSTPGDEPQSQLSIERHRRRQRKQVAAVAFTTFSVAAAVLAALGAGDHLRVDTEASVQAAEPASTPALVELNATPPAGVSVDGRDVGRTPLKLELEPGTHVVTVAQEGYEPWTETMDLEAGLRRRVDVYLQPLTVPSPAKLPAERPTRKVAAQPAPQQPTPPAQATVERAPETPPAPETTGRAPSGLLPTDGPGSALLPVK